MFVKRSILFIDISKSKTEDKHDALKRQREVYIIKLIGFIIQIK